MEIKDLGMSYPIRLFNGARNQVYFENSDGWWWKQRYDEEQRVVYFENSDGRYEWTTYTEEGRRVHIKFRNGIHEDWEYDSNNNITYKYSSETGYWWKKLYDSDGNVIFHENSYDGVIIPAERIIIINGNLYQESVIRRALERVGLI